MNAGNRNLSRENLMTNPDNIVRVRARNGGRASVYEANGWAQAFSSGLFEGNGVTQNTSADMHVLVGGSSSKPDVVLAKNPSDYKVALDIVGQQAITLTAPASNSRISAIVAYTDDLSLSTDQTTVTGSPASCGLIVVNGSASSNPSAPTDTQIRNAITADGATGSQASYAVIATVRVAHNTTVITNALITTNRATLNVANNVPDASITANKIDFTTLMANPKFIQTGSRNITYQAAGTSGGSVTVTFPVEFDHAPVVVASTKGPYSANVVDVHVQAPTTTGFSILARASGTQENGAFQWIAIDTLANPNIGE